jgi:hypothetical protein
VVVARNVIAGPWANGIAAALIDQATIEQNAVLGPGGFGLILTDFHGGAVTNNRVSRAGAGGLLLASGCYNVFTGNRLAGNDPGAVFEQPTGANTYRGDNAPVVDLGDFDCDGDGVPDPNDVGEHSAAARQLAAPAAPVAVAGRLR